MGQVVGCVPEKGANSFQIKVRNLFTRVINPHFCKCVTKNAHDVVYQKQEHNCDEKALFRTLEDLY